MKFAVDGRAIELDDTVDRIVIERDRDGTLTVTSHFGVKRQVV